VHLKLPQYYRLEMTSRQLLIVLQITDIIVTCQLTHLNICTPITMRTSGVSSGYEESIISGTGRNSLLKLTGITGLKESFLTDEEHLYQKVLDLYHGKCIHCFSPIVQIHHIKPRSRGLKSLGEDNLVPLCLEIHEQITEGNAEAWIEQIEAWKRRALKLYGNQSL